MVLAAFCLSSLQWVKLLRHWDGTVSLGHGRPQSWLDASALADSAESRYSPSIPSAWPQEPLIPSASSYLHALQKLRPLTLQTKQRRPWGFEEVSERCCNPYDGREDTAGHSAPAQSSSFCNQLPECCASQEIRAASHERWLSNPAHRASPEIRVLCRGLRTVGYWEKQSQAEKTVEGKFTVYPPLILGSWV